jgi:Kef-type K+ transport system membrane component KefB
MEIIVSVHVLPIFAFAQLMDKTVSHMRQSPIVGELLAGIVLELSPIERASEELIDPDDVSVS